MFCFIRIPSKFKGSEENRQNGLEERLIKVKDRIEFTKINLRVKFSTLAHFTKIHCFFQTFSLYTNECSCNTFWNRGECKHRLATLMHLERIQNPYLQRVQNGSQVGRPRNLMN